MAYRLNSYQVLCCFVEAYEKRTKRKVMKSRIAISYDLEGNNEVFLMKISGKNVTAKVPRKKLFLQPAQFIAEVCNPILFP